MTTAREEPIKTSPVDWTGLADLKLQAITNNTLLTNLDVDNVLQQWVSLYPTVNVDVMGQTVQTRPQKIARLFDDGLKPIIGISCGVHGNEIKSLRGWITALEWFLTANNEIAVQARNSLAIYFVPLFNPDGNVLNQKNNANNVNLNRNWPYFFSSVLDPDKGSAGLSEPETNNFATYMLADNKVQRVIGWVDAHTWTSETTFGLLHEKIYHSHDTINFARSMYNHSNALLRMQNYAAINSPVALIEYMMERKSYLASWVINNAQPGCWGGNLEFPDTESVSLCSSVAQDYTISLVLAGLQQISDGVQGKIIESSTYASTVNENANLQTWSPTEPRPEFFSGTGVSLTQVFDGGIGRNVVEIGRPNTIQLPAEQGEAAYTVVPQTNGQSVLYIIGGKTVLNNSIASVIYLNTVSRSMSTLSAFPISANYMAATNDGTNIYVSGGFTTTYVDAIYKSTGTGLGVTFSVFLSSLSVYSSGVQRHSMNYWFANNYLIISGGLDNVSYKTGIFAVDTASGYIWRIGNFVTARGWHTSTIYSNSLYAFGGWNGTTVLSSVERLTLTDNKIATGTDGAIASVNQFSSAQYTFTAGDVNKTITIQQSSNKGEYTISSFISSTTVTVSPNPPVNNTTGHAFVISNPPATASVITALPGSRHRQQISQTGAIAYLFGGMPTSTTWSSVLYRYDMSSNTVTTVSYSMNQFLDEETGVLTPIETPNLASTAGYYDPSAVSIVIAGGFDESSPTSLARKDIYEISLGDAVCSNWLYELESYGSMRMTQVFNNQKAMLVAAIKNTTTVNNAKAPYVRLTALVGPFNSPTRKIFAWHQVPSTSNYDIFMMPIQLEAGETEFRCYIRHYTAGTTIRVASFQLLAGEEKLTFPLPLSYVKAPDIYNVTLLDGLSFSNSSRFLVEGSMIPLVNTNIVVTEIPFIAFYGTGDELLFTLSYTSTSDGSVNYAATGKGTLKVNDAINNTTESRTSFEINGNRLSGKEMRYDVISWQIKKTASTNNLMLSWYGEIVSFSLTAIPPAKELKRVAFRNGIFSSISGYSQTVEPDPSTSTIDCSTYSPVTEQETVFDAGSYINI
jgi:Zinc carboxypeptidase/Kelch motif